MTSSRLFGGRGRGSGAEDEKSPTPPWPKRMDLGTDGRAIGVQWAVSPRRHFAGHAERWDDNAGEYTIEEKGNTLCEYSSYIGILILDLARFQAVVNTLRLPLNPTFCGIRVHLCPSG